VRVSKQFAMLGKAMRFATVCTLAFAICGKANRGKTASFSEGTTEDLEHRFGQETNFEDHLSTTMNVSSIVMQKPNSRTLSFSVVRKLAAILALSSALTPADALILPGLQTFGTPPLQKDSNTAFSPIHTSNPLHGTPSGPLHVSINPSEVEAMKEVIRLYQDVPLDASSVPVDGEKVKEMAHLVGRAVQDFQFRLHVVMVQDVVAAAARRHDGRLLDPSMLWTVTEEVTERSLNGLGWEFWNGLTTQQVDFLLSDGVFEVEPDISEEVQSAVGYIKRYYLANPDKVVEKFKALSSRMNPR